MVSAQRNGGASVIASRGIDVTPTPTPTNEEAFNGLRINDKYVYVQMGALSYSIHIQFFSQNQSLFSLIQNKIIRKKVTRE